MSDADRWWRRGQWIAIAVGLAALGVLLAALPVKGWIESLRGAIESLGWWGPVIYAAVHATAAILLLPSGPLQLGAGLIFGLGVGIPTALAGSWLALAGAFVIGRWLARDRIQSLLADRPRMKVVEEAIADGGWKTVILLRLSPVLPMSVHNYVYGVTRIPLRVYLPAAALAVAPGTVMWAWIGALGASAATAGGDASVVKWILRGLGLAATIAVTVLLARRARSRLDERTADETEPGSSEQSPSDDEPSGSGGPPRWRVIALAAAAAALVAGAALSHIYDDTVERWLGGDPGATPYVCRSSAYAAPVAKRASSTSAGETPCPSTVRASARAAGPTPPATSSPIRWLATETARA